MHSTPDAQRIYGLDLLRVIAMFMVVVLHVLGQGGILKSSSVLSANYELAWFMEIAAYCAVNCYALISGYVGILIKPKRCNIVMLWLQVAFYSFGITLLFKLFLPYVISTKSVILSMFPVFTEQYWYFTAYFCLYLFIPFINSAINALPQKTLKEILITSAIAFTLPQIFFRIDPFHVVKGYSAAWVIFLYILGAYLRKHSSCIRVRKRTLFIVYVLSVAVTWGVKFAIEFISFIYKGQAIDGNLLVEYTSPTMLIASVALLLLFSKIKTSVFIARFVSFVSPASFGIYIIHTHPLIFYGILTDTFAGIAGSPLAITFLLIIGSAFLIFVICFGIELLRIRLFKALKLKQLISRLDDKLSRT